MSRQLLIYNDVAPLSFARHGNLSIKTTDDFGFASHLNSVPLVASEIIPAAAEYPVVFAVSPEGVVPVVLLGVEEGVNLYVDGDGKWQGRYVPAFLRRYPFVFSTEDEGSKLTLCVDESFVGCNREDRGERLFDAEGTHTLRLKGVLDFLQQYQVEFERTKLFGKTLQDLDLLEPMTAKFNLPDNSQCVLGGFSVVNRNRLRSLSGEVLERLAKTDELELAYAQLQSMTHFANLLERVSKQSSEKQASTEASAAV